MFYPYEANSLDCKCYNTVVSFCVFIFCYTFSFFPQTSTEENKGEKKSDQPPQAKKPKVKTKVLELPIENNPQWQLANDMLNLFVENEVPIFSPISHTDITQSSHLAWE